MTLMDVTAALTRLKAFCNPLAKKAKLDLSSTIIHGIHSK
jgi:hypothetical protein